jgi:hypothetical protein
MDPESIKKLLVQSALLNAYAADIEHQQRLWREIQMNSKQYRIHRTDALLTVGECLDYGVQYDLLETKMMKLYQDSDYRESFLLLERHSMQIVAHALNAEDSAIHARSKA